MQFPHPRRLALLLLTLVAAGCDVHTEEPTGPAGPAALALITVTPNITLPIGATQQFVAVGTNGNGDVMAITPTWSVVGGGGTITGAGLFTAGATAGTYPATVRATSGNRSGTATVIVLAATPPVPLIALGGAASHGILAGSTISCVTLGTVGADASVSPGSAITGFPPCVITGTQHAADAFALAAQNDLTTAYDQLAGLPCSATLSADLGGQTLRPGVYCSLSSQGLTGEVFLDALGDANAVFVIRAASTITTAGASVTLLNGAQSRNVHWHAGSSITVGTASAMKGNLIALSSISLLDTTTLIGRALARNGAVSLGNNVQITLP